MAISLAVRGDGDDRMVWQIRGDAMWVVNVVRMGANCLRLVNMGDPMRLTARVLVLALMAFAAGAAHAAGPRIALVIGNGAYADSPLRNPVNDARLMSAALRSHGFSVIEALDVGQIAMKRAIKEYGNRLEAAGPDAVGWFFYAGHGLQVDGENYLIPVGAEVEDGADVDIYAVAASNLLKTIRRAGNGLNIVVLDACRNNPFMRSFRSPQRGLALMSAPTGTLIAYSTAPGDVAADGDGVNSPYTAALAAKLGSPGLPVELMFKDVRDAVLVATQGRQTPWEASSLTGAVFRLVPQVESVEPAPGPSREALDLAFWQSIQDTRDARQIEAYLAQFSDGAFADLARLRLDELARGAEVAAVVPPPSPLGGSWRAKTEFQCRGDISRVRGKPRIESTLRFRIIDREVFADIAFDGEPIESNQRGLPLDAEDKWQHSFSIVEGANPAAWTVIVDMRSKTARAFIRSPFYNCNAIFERLEGGDASG